MVAVQGELWTSVAISTPSENFNYGTIHNRYWHDARMEFIITIADLQDAGFQSGDSITEIRQWVETIANSPREITNARLALKHTSSNSFSTGDFSVGHPYSSFTEVFFSSSMDFPTAQSWVAFVLSTPFVWNGTDNVIVHLSRDMNSFTDAGATRVRSVGANRLRLAYHDSEVAFPYDTKSASLYATLPRTYLVADRGESGTSATLSVGVSTSDITALNPVINTTSNVSVYSNVSQVTTDSLDPIVSVVANVTINATIATVTGQVYQPVITTESPHTSIFAEVSAVSANAIDPEISGDSNVISVTMDATITTNNPVIDTYNEVNISASLSNISNALINPSIHTDSLINVIVSSLQAEILQPIISLNAVEFEKVIKRTLSINAKYTSALNVNTKITNDLKINRSYKSNLNI